MALLLHVNSQDSVPVLICPDTNPVAIHQLKLQHEFNHAPTRPLPVRPGAWQSQATAVVPLQGRCVRLLPQLWASPQASHKRLYAARTLVSARL